MFVVFCSLGGKTTSLSCSAALDGDLRSVWLGIKVIWTTFFLLCLDLSPFQILLILSFALTVLYSISTYAQHFLFFKIVQGSTTINI